MFSTLSRRALPGLAVLLAACGGDHDHARIADPGPQEPAEPTAVRITDENDGDLISEVLFLTSVLGLRITPALEMNILPVATCDNPQGIVDQEHEPGGDGRLIAARYDNCEVSPPSGMLITLDGDLTIEYDSDDEASARQIQADDFVFQLEQDTRGNRFVLNGALRQEPTPIWGLMFPQTLNANLDLRFDYLEDGEPVHRFQWATETFIVSPALSDMGELQQGAFGRVTFIEDGKQQYVDVITAMNLLYSSLCPEQSDFTITGADDTRVHLLANYEDEFVLTTNGNAEVIDCAGFTNEIPDTSHLIIPL